MPYTISGGETNKTWAPQNTNITTNVNYADVIDTIHPGHFVDNFSEDFSESGLYYRQKLAESDASIAELGISIKKDDLFQYLEWFTYATTLIIIMGAF